MDIKIETNIDKNTLNKLKEELKSKQIEFIYKKFDDEEFRTSIKQELKKAVDFAFDKPLNYYVKSVDEIKSKVDWNSIREIASGYLFKYAKIFTEFEKEYIKNYDVTVNDLVTKAFVDKVNSAIDEPLNFEEDTVREFINQKAIKELFITLIYSALEKFAKNLPLSNFLVSIEKEIKKFLSHGMNFTLDIATRFITDKKNEPLIQDALKKFFRIILSQKLNLIVNRLEIGGFKGNEDELYKELAIHIIETPMVEDGLNYTLSQFYKKENTKSIKELIGNPEIINQIEELVTENIYTIMLDFISSDSAKSFFDKYITEFYDSIELA